MAWIFNDSSLMPTGKYKGKRMADIPADYLLFIYDNRRWGRRRDLLIYIMEREKDLRKEVKRQKRNDEILNEINAAIDNDTDGVAFV